MFPLKPFPSLFSYSIPFIQTKILTYLPFENHYINFWYENPDRWFHKKHSTRDQLRFDFGWIWSWAVQKYLTEQTKK